MKELLTYFVFAYLISWTIWLPLYGHIFGWKNLHTLPYHHRLGGLGPLIASFLTSWIFNKKRGINLLLKNCFKFRPIFYLLVAIFSPFLIIFIATLLNYFINNSLININSLLITKEFPQFNLFIFFIYNLIFFGYGEEVGWRGFALPRLQEKFNALNSSVILTLFWAIWHLPLFFYRPGFISMDFAGIIGWLFSLLTGSILLTWLYNSSKEGILICAVFHSTINIAFSADIANKNLVNYMGLLITIWGILTIFLLKRKNLDLNSTY